MRRLYGFILVLALAFALPAFSQQRWERNYGGTGADEEGYSVQQTFDGGYIVTGSTNGAQFYLVKTNATGDTLWTRAYGGAGSDEGYSVQQTSDGGYILAGVYDIFGSNHQVYLVKTNASGDTLWTRDYGGSGRTAFDYGRSVQQTSEGGYIVAGYTYSFGNSAQFYLIKTNATGDTLWTRTYGGLDIERGYSVQQTSDGGYIVAGETFSFGNFWQVYLIKTNATGDTLWTRNYGGASDDWGRSVQQTTDGGYIVAGYTNSYGNWYQVYLIKTNASGDTLWTRTYGGTEAEEGFSVRQTTEGGYIVAGYTPSFGNGIQVYLIKTNAGGDTLWTRTYGGAGDDRGYSVRQTSDGGYIVAGETNSFGNGGQVYLIKTNANGSSGVEEARNAEFGMRNAELRITPNPFTSFATLPGHEAERFSLYDVSGRKVGTYQGDRVGEGLGPGVYFLRYQEMLKQVQHDAIVRIVKVR